MLRVEGSEGSEIKAMHGKSKVEEEAGLAHGSLAVHPGRAIRLSHACAGRLASPAPQGHTPGWKCRWAGICAKWLVAPLSTCDIVHEVLAIPEYNHELFCLCSKGRGP